MKKRGIYYVPNNLLLQLFTGIIYRRRIKQTKIENAKQRLQLHLQETKEQQNRLKHLISDLSSGKSATKDKAQLPIPTPPKSLKDSWKDDFCRIRA
ncbi:MAG: hypothetical protein WAM14_10240 [Candidatus Nitrosopolaris sp.]